MDASAEQAVAEGLAARSLSRGKVIACIGGAHPDVWALARAAQDLGLVLAVLNDSWTACDLDRLLDKLGAQLTMGYGPRARRPALRNLLDWMIDDTGVWRPSDGRERTRRIRTSHGLAGSVEGAVVFSTSGSSGAPKCVVSSPENQDFCCATIGGYLGLEAGHQIISALPPSFDYGFYQGLMAHHFGAELSLVATPRMVGEVLARVAAGFRVVLPLTPAMAAHVCLAAEGRRFPQVEIVSLTGGAVPRGLRHALADTFPAARIFAMYGLTECKRVAFLDPSQFLSRPDSCGQAMPGVDVHILGEDHAAVAEGQVGELVVSGPNVCLGYWGDPAANQRVYRQHPVLGATVYTGDRFRRDADGYLEFVGRRDSLVKLRDERVSLAAVEAELKHSPLVLDLVIRLDSGPWDVPVLTAFVVPAHACISELQIKQSFEALVSRVAHLPDRIFLSEALAVGAHGKPVAAAAPGGRCSGAGR